MSQGDLREPPDPSRIGEFVALFTSHELRLRAYAMSLIPNHADADDVLQQSNLLLWKKFDTFRTGTDFMGWAVRVVYHEVQRYRRRQVRDRLEFCDEFLEAVSAEAITPEMSTMMAEVEARLATCIAKLRPDHRAILTSRYTRGWDIERIAESYKRSVDAIYNLLSRIRRNLQVCVGETSRPGAR